MTRQKARIKTFSSMSMVFFDMMAYGSALIMIVGGMSLGAGLLKSDWLALIAAALAIIIFFTGIFRQSQMQLIICFAGCEGKIFFYINKSDLDYLQESDTTVTCPHCNSEINPN